MYGNKTLFEILQDLFTILLRFTNNILDFLFNPVTLGIDTIDFGIIELPLNWSITFVPFYSIGGPILVTLIVLRLIKEYLPLV